MTLPTYGEAHINKSHSMSLVCGVWTSNRLEDHKPKMDKSDAAKYYTKKISKIWSEIL